MSKLTKDEAVKLCDHYGHSEKTGFYDSQEVTTTDGVVVTLKAAREIAHGAATAKAKKK